MTENKTKQYSDNQYNRTPDHELGSGFSNYDRLMVELNNRQYYPKEVYENFLNEMAWMHMKYLKLLENQN